jgi:hypothetical protein
MAGTASRPKRRERLPRLRNLFSHSPALANQTNLSSSTSPSTTKPIPSRPTSSTPSVASCRSLKSDPGAPPASPNSQRVSPTQQFPPAASAPGRELFKKALELLGEQQRTTIQEHILPTTDDVESALRDTFNAAQEKQNICENKR